MRDDEYITIEGTPNDLGGRVLDKIKFSQAHGLTKCIKCFPQDFKNMIDDDVIPDVIPVGLCPKHFSELPDSIKKGLASVD